MHFHALHSTKASLKLYCLRNPIRLFHMLVFTMVNLRFHVILLWNWVKASSIMKLTKIKPLEIISYKTTAKYIQKFHLCQLYNEPADGGNSSHGRVCLFLWFPFSHNFSLQLYFIYYIPRVEQKIWCYVKKRSFNKT